MVEIKNNFLYPQVFANIFVNVSNNNRSKYSNGSNESNDILFSVNDQHIHTLHTFQLSQNTVKKKKTKILYNLTNLDEVGF